MGATAKIFVAKPTTGTASMLAIMINAKVAKPKASFLVSGSVDTWRHNALSDYGSSRLSDLSFFWANMHFDFYCRSWRYCQS